MFKIFDYYATAHAAAQESANHVRIDIGIERVDGPLGKGFKVFMLPKPINRSGFELRCEVVQPDSVRCEGPDCATRVQYVRKCVNCMVPHYKLD